MKKLHGAIAFLLLAAILTSCGDNSTPGDVTTEPDGTDDAATTQTAETEYVYPYPSEGYGGEEFNLLNMNDLYTMKCQFDRAEQTGDVLDNAIYERNRLVESKFDIKFVETIVEEDWELKKVANAAQQSILADDDAFDVMFVPIKGASSIILQNGFIDLASIDEIQLDQPWWYQSYNDKIMINNCLYGAMGGAHTCVHDATRMLTFNADMLKKLNLDAPYDLVRNDKWTIDRFNEYLTAAANLNGDGSAEWRKNGNVIYGYSNNKNNVGSFVHGFGEDTIIIENGVMKLDTKSERFINCIDKLKTVLTTADAKGINCPNGTDSADDDGNPGYLRVFTSQRALFVGAEVNKLASFRSLEFEYGIVPYPKLDENQDAYYNDTWTGAPAAFIPVTSRDPGKVGLILDAAAYEGERTVTPAYRDVTIEQKGLRNEDSIEMLAIITANTIPSPIGIYGISNPIFAQAGLDVWTGTNKLASAIAENESTLNARIDEITDAMSK